MFENIQGKNDIAILGLPAVSQRLRISQDDSDLKQ